MSGSDGFATLATDVLVIGGGLAALRAALSARQAGAEVLMVSKRQVGRSGSSVNTTGGYAAVLSDLNAQDEERLHYIDTIVGGSHVNDRALVRTLAWDAPARLRELLGYGAAFRRRDGHYHLSPSGDHTQNRVLVPQNMRGLDLTIPLREAVIAEGVKFLEDAVVLDLLRDDDRIAGATGFYRLRPEGFMISAGAVIVAAGGAGQLFATTSNPSDVCGSGYALALRAGAKLRDMEFIQFYPWRLIRPFKSVRVPIQPSTFALGGRLYNSAGERFMEKYDPVRKESTTRDLSARGIADQISNGLSVEGGVVLDVSDVPDDQFRFENVKMIELLARKNLDYRNIQLIVAPEAHYFMGGIDIDDSGRSSVEGLFAAGESAGGVHGGNRLNSNSIPDTQVFGHRAGIAAASLARSAKSARADLAPTTALSLKLAQLSSGDDGAGQYQVLGDHLRGVMGRKVGLVRSSEGLNVAIREITEVREAAKRLPIHSQAELIAAVELGDLCESALACAKSAACRTESRGAHYRADFPDADPAWIRTVLYDGNGIDTRAIATDPDEDRFVEFRARHAAAANRRDVEHVE
jgi:fumarate reductase (CoM/CoB) subunit A